MGNRRIILREWFYENSLSISFVSLFVVSIIGQSISGQFSYNLNLTIHNLPPIGYTTYLKSGDFLDGIFVNWQAAILQLGCLIVFSEFLYQKGASHSRRLTHFQIRTKPEHLEPGSWLYRNSLSFAFVLAFIGSFIAHLIFGTWSYNEMNGMNNQSQISILKYFFSSACWFKILQTWEAEFIVMAFFIISSIFLRQQRSPESKPLGSSNAETGEINK